MWNIQSPKNISSEHICVFALLMMFRQKFWDQGHTSHQESVAVNNFQFHVFQFKSKYNKKKLTLLKDCIKSFNSKRMRKGIWIVFAKSSRSKRKLKGSVYSYWAVQIICISFVERFLAYSWALQPNESVLSVRYSLGFYDRAEPCLS